MTTGLLDGPRRGGEHRHRPRRRLPILWALAALAVILVFAVGVALGQALQENPESGETRTSVRTLVPDTLPPETVTVTVSAP